MPVGRAGVFLNLEPVVGTIRRVTILDEQLTALTLLGGVLSIGSAVYFSVHPHED
jgi:drug/metabolite transporter (DMT)-like permease